MAIPIRSVKCKFCNKEIRYRKAGMKCDSWALLQSKSGDDFAYICELCFRTKNFKSVYQVWYSYIDKK